MGYYQTFNSFQRWSVALCVPTNSSPPLGGTEGGSNVSHRLQRDNLGYYQTLASEGYPFSVSLHLVYNKEQGADYVKADDALLGN